jgi:solute carrier family 35, member E3
MADRVQDRDGSIGSSSTEAEPYDESEKNQPNGDSSYVHLKTPEEMEIADEESAELLPAAAHVVQQTATETEKTSVRTAVIWMVVNTLATIGIVSLALEILALVMVY